MMPLYLDFRLQSKQRRCFTLRHQICLYLYGQYKHRASCCLYHLAFIIGFSSKCLNLDQIFSPVFILACFINIIVRYLDINPTIYLFWYSDEISRTTQACQMCFALGRSWIFQSRLGCFSVFVIMNSYFWGTISTLVRYQTLASSSGNGPLTIYLKKWSQPCGRFAVALHVGSWDWINWRFDRPLWHTIFGILSCRWCDLFWSVKKVLLQIRRKVKFT